MKNGRIQVKDISDYEVMGSYFALEDARTKAKPVGHLLCEHYPWKVVARKLDNMERRGLIERWGFGDLYGLINPKDDEKTPQPEGT